MADNTFNSFPTPPKTAGDIATGGTEKSAPKEQVEIINISKDLRELRFQAKTSQRIEGRVTQTDPQTNRVVIKTAKGEIEVQLPKEQPLPPRGTPVEIKLPPQNAKQQTATLQQLPPAPTKADEVTLNQSKPAPVRPYPPPTTTQPPSQQLPPPLQQGQPVRIVPLPPASLPEITVQPLPSTATTRIPPTPNPIALTQPTLPLAPISTPQIPPIPIPTIPLPIALSPVQAPVPAIEVFLQTIIASQSQNIQIPTPIEILKSPLPPAQSAQVIVPSNGIVTPLLPMTQLPSQPLLVSNQQVVNRPAVLSTNILPQQPVTAIPSQLQYAPSIITPEQPQSLSQILQTQPPALLAPQATPATLPATVIGHTVQGQPVISIPQFSLETAPQFFTLQNVSLPLGTTFALPITELAQAILPHATTTSSGPMPLPARAEALFQAPGWPALTEIMEVLQQANPALAQQVSQILPSARAPANIPPALMLFLAVVKGGDLSTWIGEKPAEMLRRIGRGDLINRLGNDGANINRAAAESLPNDWKGMIFPFHSGQELQNLVVYYKQDEAQSDSGEGKKQTRFIFDMNLSRMGDVQLDGLFKPAESTKRLDLVIRTEVPLSDPMKQDMRQNYAKVLRYNDIAGELTFQGEKASFVKILTQKENVKFMT